MKNHRKLGLVSAFLLLALPAMVLAEVYYYVDTSGQVRTVVADDPQSAIDMAPNRAPTSGVMLATGIFGTGGGILAGTYQYIDINGNARTVQASSAEEAMLIAPNKHPESGVRFLGDNF